MFNVYTKNWKYITTWEDWYHKRIKFLNWITFAYQEHMLHYESNFKIYWIRFSQTWRVCGKFDAKSVRENYKRRVCHSLDYPDSTVVDINILRL